MPVNTPAVERDFTHGKVHRKGGPIFALPHDLPSNADDFAFTGIAVVGKISVMLLAIR
jgi:hypothetical protein